MATKIADEYAAIRARVEELERERLSVANQSLPEPPTTIADLINKHKDQSVPDYSQSYG